MWTLEEKLKTSESEVLSYLAAGLMAAIIIDERLGEAYPNTLMSDRWVKLVKTAVDELGSTSSPESWASLIGVGLSFLYYAPLLGRAARWLRDKVRKYARDPRAPTPAVEVPRRIERDREVQPVAPHRAAIIERRPGA